MSGIAGEVEIDWKNQAERQAFEDAFYGYREKRKNRPGCEKLTWFFTVFILNGSFIIAMYGSAAYILINEAWDTKAAEEAKMKEDWIVQRQVMGRQLEFFRQPISKFKI